MERIDSPKQIELANQNLILSCLQDARGEISRASIAKRVGLSRTTVSSSISYLIELGLVREQDGAGAVTGRGRPGIPVSLTRDIWYAAGATLMDDEALFVLLQLDGTPAQRFTLPVGDESAETFLSVLADGFERLIALCPGRLLPMLGVGAPGIISEGKILEASDMDWTDIPVSDYLMKRLGLPSVVLNRHWASCISEYRAAGYDSMIYVGISTGIAAALIFNGQLFTGAYHSAGEIAHTVVNPDGPLCVCGRRGCLHAISSERAITKHISDHYKINPGPVIPGDPIWETASRGIPVTIAEICEAAKKHHPLAEQQLETAANYLGLSISNLTGMFNPQCVVLGGSLVERAGKRFSDRVIDHIKNYSRPDIFREVRFYPWTQGRYSGAVGAACQVLDQKIELAASGKQA